MSLVKQFIMNWRLRSPSSCITEQHQCIGSLFCSIVWRLLIFHFGLVNLVQSKRGRRPLRNVNTYSLPKHTPFFFFLSFLFFCALLLLFSLFLLFSIPGSLPLLQSCQSLFIHPGKSLCFAPSRSNPLRPRPPSLLSKPRPEFLH